MQAFFNYCLEHFIECATFRLIYWKVIVGILRYIEKKIEKKKCHNVMVHFTVVCLVAKSSNMSEARGDVVMIQSKPCCFQM